MAEREDSVTAPSCPSCEDPMVLRMNRREGNYFWGCRRYPACRGTRDIGSDSGDSQVEDKAKSPTQVRVLWNDATLDRSGWQCRYTTAGGRLRSSPTLMGISNEFRQCWMARTASTFAGVREPQQSPFSWAEFMAEPVRPKGRSYSQTCRLPTR